MGCVGDQVIHDLRLRLNGCDSINEFLDRSAASSEKRFEFGDLCERSILRVLDGSNLGGSFLLLFENGS